MRDAIFVLIPVGFFALAAAYVRACGRIIGSDEAAGGELVEGGLGATDDGNVDGAGAVHGAVPVR